MCLWDFPSEHQYYSGCDHVTQVMDIQSTSFNSLSIFTQLSPSPQLTLPEGRMWHSTTPLSLGLGWTQVTMFGGCPKWESGKSHDAQQKLAKTTVLDFGEQITQNSIHSLAVSRLYILYY